MINHVKSKIRRHNKAEKKNTVKLTATSVGLLSLSACGEDSGGIVISASPAPSSSLNFTQIKTNSYIATNEGEGEFIALDADVVFAVQGGSFSEVIYTGSGDDVVLAGAGDDEVRGGAGADFLSGGDGYDLVTYSTIGEYASPTGVNVNFLTHEASGGDAEGDRLSNFEAVSGTIYDDILVGDQNSNVIMGWAGNNQLTGNGGNDYITSGSGDDVIDGGSGNDYIDAGNGNNVIDGGSGNNVIIAGAGNDVITAGDGDDLIYGGGGDNLIDAGNGNNTVYANGSSGSITAGINNDVFYILVDDSLNLTGITMNGGDGANDVIVYTEETNVVKSVDFQLLSGSGINSIDVTSTDVDMTFTNILGDDVIAFSNITSSLIIKGDSGDTVILDNLEWTESGVQVIEGQTYQTYSYSSDPLNALLYLDTDMAINVI